MSTPSETAQTTLEEIDVFFSRLFGMLVSASASAAGSASGTGSASTLGSASGTGQGQGQGFELDEILRGIMLGLERVTGEVFRQVRDFDLDPKSIILNLPPFLSQPFITTPPPPPPPPPPAPELTLSTLHKPLVDYLGRQMERNRWVVAGVGVGLVGVGWSVGGRWVEGRRERGVRRREGRVGDGFMRDAVLIICPNPITPLLYPLILTLLKNQYVVLLGLPDLDLVEDVERWLRGLSGGAAGAGGMAGMAGGMVLGQGVWVGVLDCDDPTSVQAFHRSLYAAMTTRYPSVIPPSSSSSSSHRTSSHSMSSWASGRYGDDRKPITQKYAPLPRHLPRLKFVFNLYGLGSGRGRAGEEDAGGSSRGRARKDRVPPIPMLLRSPTSYSSYVSLGTSAASASAAYVSGSGSGQDGEKSRPRGRAEDKEEVALFTFVPTRTLWPIPREFDRQLDTVENLLLGRNAMAESSARGKEKRRGEVVGVGRHVEVYVGDLRPGLEGLDLRKLLAPRIRARGSRVDWFDKAPFREFMRSDSLAVRVLAPLRLGLDVAIGTASWPWRKLVARVQRTRRERRRRTGWDSVEDGLLSGMKRGGWGLGLGVVGLGNASVWPYILASILPTRILAFLLKNTSIADTLPPYLPPTRSFSSTTTPTTPTSTTSETDGLPRTRGGRDTPTNPRSEPSPERQSSEGTGTGTMPSLGDSFLSSRSTDGMDSSWVGVEGGR